MAVEARRAEAGAVHHIHPTQYPLAREPGGARVAQDAEPGGRKPAERHAHVGRVRQVYLAVVGVKRIVKDRVQPVLVLLIDTAQRLNKIIGVLPDAGSFSRNQATVDADLHCAGPSPTSSQGPRVISQGERLVLSFASRRLRSRLTQ